MGNKKGRKKRLRKREKRDRIIERIREKRK